MRVRISSAIVTALIVAICVAQTVYAQAQNETPLELRINRDFGFGLGGQIQGRFSMRISGPVDLERVAFYVDDMQIGEDNEPPFVLTFNTGDYERGVHQLHAVGMTQDGRELNSNSVTRQFVSGQSVALIVAAIIGVVVAIGLAIRYITRGKGQISGREYGLLGGAVCPNCGRPFGIHWWSLRLGVGRLDRCPHCRKWNMISRSSHETLAAAERSGTEQDELDDLHSDKQPSEEDELRRQLDDSRYSQDK